jgi:UDPglucose 6-dehydrogenase
MLAQVCETLPGADVDVITAAIGCDTRIGTKYLKGALGYGGPCFPRDNRAFSALARDNGAPALLAEATDALNSRQVPRMAEQILAKLPKGGTAGVIGLSYKPYTEVIEQSQGMMIAQKLLEAGVKLMVYDPEAMNNAKRELSGNVTYAASASECVRAVDVLAITTPWPEFARLTVDDIKAGPVTAVVDCWRVLSPEARDCVAEYFTLGKGWSAGKGVPQMAAQAD